MLHKKKWFFRVKRIPPPPPRDELPNTEGQALSQVGNKQLGAICPLYLLLKYATLKYATLKYLFFRVQKTDIQGFLMSMR